MILLYLWEFELIMKTENRYHEPTDFLDYFYSAFPIFERREMIKIILIPSMNIIQMFFRFYIQSDSQKKILRIAKNPRLRNLTGKVREAANKVEIDEHLEDRLQAALTEEKRKNPTESDIYLLQRKALQLILYLEGENILLDS